MNLKAQRGRRLGSGFGLIEIVLAAAIIVLVIAAVSGAFQPYIRLANTNSQYTQAVLLTEEGLEALNILRDIGWTSKIVPLTLGTTYYLYWDGTQYATTTVPTSIQNTYMRTIVLSSVKRDASDNISSTGTVDPNTRMATVSIWLAAASSTALLKTDFLIHNVYTN